MAAITPTQKICSNSCTGRVKVKLGENMQSMHNENNNSTTSSG